MGLSNSSVSRLTQTWEKLPSKFRKMYAAFEVSVLMLTDLNQHNGTWVEAVALEALACTLFCWWYTCLWTLVSLLYYVFISYFPNCLKVQRFLFILLILVFVPLSLCAEIKTVSFLLCSHFFLSNCIVQINAQSFQVLFRWNTEDPESGFTFTCPPSAINSCYWPLMTSIIEINNILSYASLSLSTFSSIKKK